MPATPQRRYIVDEEGERRAVIVPIEEYLRLQEDLRDLAVVAERRDEQTVSLDEVRRRLQEDGLL